MRRLIFLALCVCVGFSQNLKNSQFFKDVNSTCPIKFIDVFKYPDWIAAVEYKNGKKVLFSSAKQMFYYIYTSKPKEVVPLKKLYVTDYKTKELIEATDAFYVFGSRIVSFSGDDLIPFRSYDDAKEFADKTSASRIFEFSKINKKLIDYLN
ncbi:MULTISPECIES: nitrous oxide reductase accessory protein NosL [Campylobacter]|uniref:Nitrous oxide reductase accessory protein n=1 Tax=Campylobacter porcelli TaxID=1660073 RepID=A0A1X9SXT4_9BACT|nr:MULTISPECIES: nitrous oxide reductase accessory protein NosL [unclassified Campylobacter]ARR01087.1 nitrous oxide reductase accessory protein [Campylobacter sp. RM6137]MCR8679348.1 nitrous oxide reductase accessory protein NosL [Campylobacter sp. RM19072]MCR8696546.1 nitrous oxide reductase accessory protein NosL [Campylobacter sp. RM19073]MEE3777246.1 nitrous oxide reductase accessory protein NosL [Campylobacter sp. CX2-4080-23]